MSKIGGKMTQTLYAPFDTLTLNFINIRHTLKICDQLKVFEISQPTKISQKLFNTENVHIPI